MSSSLICDQTQLRQSGLNQFLYELLIKVMMMMMIMMKLLHSLSEDSESPAQSNRPAVFKVWKMNFW